jgi:3',5'-cyclic AMP phosphodiesterase CpdA
MEKEMTKIIHISDLHFGRENPSVVNSILVEIDAYQPDVVIVSGDLTQRARPRQFMKAAEFLKKIPASKVIVPGNHDVPLYDVTRRFLAPFNRYVRYINDEFFPHYQNDEVAIIGINTAHSFTWKSGRVTANQLQIVAQKFKDQGQRIKMLVMHHPFHELFYATNHHELLASLGVDLIFTGHLHQARSNILIGKSAVLNYKTLIVQAGTSVSKRLRGENNSFNQIKIHERDKLTIIVKEYADQSFFEKTHYFFQKKGDQWQTINNVK